jgi:hypothetical protein
MTTQKSPLKLLSAIGCAAFLSACAGDVEEADLETIESGGGVDPISYWNEQYDNATLAAFGSPQFTHPGLQIRGAAMVHVSMHDAVSSITGEYDVYGTNVAVPAGASAVAAAHAAGATAMIFNFNGYPNCVSGTACSPDVIGGLLAAQLAAIPDSQSKADGVAVGSAAAEQIFFLRLNDGWFDVLPPFFGGPNAGQPGVWVPTAPFFQPGFMQEWADRVPWAMTSPSQFNVPPPPPLTSSIYARDYNEVKKYGENDSTSRTADQTDSALAFQGKLPSYIFHPIMRQLVAQRPDFNLSKRARIFALLTIAADDTTIATLYSKVHWNFWRPITAIQNGDADGNNNTAGDPSWLPLVVTPPFQEYPSAHASVSAQLAGMIALYFGNNHNVSFTTTEFFFHTTDGLPDRPITRSFTKISDIAKEVLSARVWAGIHYRFSDNVGALQGAAVGAWTISEVLRPN